jgi:hypothetical protein
MTPGKVFRVLHGILHDAFPPVWELKDPLASFFYWLGRSLGMHAFPSKDDLSLQGRSFEHLGNSAREGEILDLAAIISHAILYVLNYPRIVRADLGNGIVMEILGPIALLRALAG